MELVEHLAASAVASPLLALVWLPKAGPTELAAVSAAGIAAGVLVDLDHFPVQRIETGSWQVKQALSNPVETATDNRSAIPEFEPWKKYAVHSISMPAICIGSFLLHDPSFPVVAGSLGLHLSMDLAHSYRVGEFPFRARLQG